MEVAGVRLPAHLLRGVGERRLWWGPLSFYLLIHDALHALTEFIERFTLLDEFEDRFKQRLGHVHLHILTSFRKGLSAPALHAYIITFYVIYQLFFRDFLKIFRGYRVDKSRLVW